ncbi:hypothetical protein D3C80_1364040 [compost metagenome]
MRQCLNVLEDRLFLPQQTLRQHPIHRAQRGLVLCQLLQGTLQLSRNRFGLYLLVLVRADLRTEGRVVAGRCQHLVHFPQAPPQHSGEFFQFAERVVVPLLFGHGIGQFIADRPFQVALGPLPGIALITQIALGDHQQRVLTLPVAAYHRT